ncbi:MAG: DDE-type integrase/transposase/recombinase, partial [Synergistaceae bacterium]|nr:DDE-type integrase/transposase/recombinase [Synergistaceae bacterium]
TETVSKEIENVRVEVPNHEVVEEIKRIQSDPDTDYGYRKMYFVLMMLGYYINHKKVYRLMQESGLLKERYKRIGKTYAKYRVVIPEGPLEVLEMDIKLVWVVKDRRHAYVLTVIDTFTRAVLYRGQGFSMKSAQVQRAWEYIILHHLQPADMLRKKIHIEVRNDNGPQFASKVIRQFFELNYLDQVFTHPYTPQENGHIESFHSILSKAIGSQVFWDLPELETFLTLFYEKYNNHRIHASIANLSPRLFWNLWEEGKISRTVLKNKKVRFNLLIPYQQLSGKMNLREVPCLHSSEFDTQKNVQKEVSGPEALQQPSVQKSPSVVPC